MRVLVVEDERQLAEAIARGLRREAMAVDLAFDGAEALDKAEINEYDVIVLDRDLPKLHGDEVCKKIVAHETAPRILMLTASGEVEDRVQGLGLGADDYLGKPFAFRELVARIRTLSRRPSRQAPAVVSKGGVVLDPGKKTATRAERDLELTKKEFAVLEALMNADGRVVSAEELLEHVWDENADPFTNTVRVTVSNLRRKLGDPPLITTVIGTGYKI